MEPEKKFDPSKAIKSYRADKIIEHELFDFLEAPLGDPAFKTWEDHFRQQEIPYVITKYHGLWYDYTNRGVKSALGTDRDIGILWKRKII